MFGVRLLNPLKLKGLQSCSHNISTIGMALARNGRSSFIARDLGSQASSIKASAPL